MTPPVARFARAIALMTMLVAAPARASAPAGRFTATGGVVTDHKTGLNWQQVVSTTTYTYTNALPYCSGNTAALAGSGWRLPAIKELQTLVDDSVASPGPTIDAIFTSTPANYFWSATVYAPNSAAAWTVYFNDGGTASNGVGGTGNVRCVR